jgi:hypothetical protein
MKKRKQEPDPFAEIREWQDHRLDPGYFTGGRIHPMYRSRKPNPWGWVLVVIGGLSAVYAPLAVSAGKPLFEGIWAGALAVLWIMAGVRLVRGPRKH